MEEDEEIDSDGSDIEAGFQNKPPSYKIVFPVIIYTPITSIAF